MQPANQRPLKSIPHQRVVVAMSGGVDSSVAAALLVRQGYEVIGLMMRLWSEPVKGAGTRPNRCCTPDQMADARRVADQLGIPFYVLDAQSLFHRTVVRYFISEHSLGRTPNPCIVCNREVRFSYLLEQAMALDADFLATGHYARVQCGKGQYQLLKARDEAKDQSYVLHVLGQNELSRTLFPIGDHTKSEVRELASEFDLPVAEKKESMDLCFLSDGDYRRFLKEHAPQIARPGPILSESGETLGLHTGLPDYTIGQRKGLGIATGESLFVLRKSTRQNALIVGGRERLGRRRLIARNVNWVAGAPPAGPIRADVMIRYKARPISATIEVVDYERAAVDFDQPAIGVTAGQGAVFYTGEVCLGGGIIVSEPHT